MDDDVTGNMLILDSKESQVHVPGLFGRRRFIIDDFEVGKIIDIYGSWFILSRKIS